MNDSPTATPTGRPSLSSIEVFAMLGSKSRWPIILLLSDGKPRTTTDVAAVVKRDFDGVSKQLRLLRSAGLLVCREGEDRRLLFFSMPEVFRQVPGMLDFGVCTVRLP